MLGLSTLAIVKNVVQKFAQALERRGLSTDTYPGVKGWYSEIQNPIEELERFFDVGGGSTLHPKRPQSSSGTSGASSKSWRRWPPASTTNGASKTPNPKVAASSRRLHRRRSEQAARHRGILFRSGRPRRSASGRHSLRRTARSGSVAHAGPAPRAGFGRRPLWRARSSPDGSGRAIAAASFEGRRWRWQRLPLLLWRGAASPITRPSAKLRLLRSRPLHLAPSALARSGARAPLHPRKGRAGAHLQARRR